MFFKRLWPRGALDISTRDLIFAFQAVLLPARAPRRVWPTLRPHLALLSVRSAWDAFLATRNWPRGSEIIVSQINVPAMFQLIAVHGFVAVAAPLDLQTLSVRAEEIAALITPRTRAILVAPLFGSRMDLSEIAVLARENGLILVEDGAQMFCGAHFYGSAEADLTFFSFGLLKTATALGGAVVFARDVQILRDLENYSAQFPRVSTGEFLKRWTRAVALKIASCPPVFGLLWQLLKKAGHNPDQFLQNATRGFGADWLSQIRRRPHRAALQLLRRRLSQSPQKPLLRRTARGQMARDFSGIVGRAALQNTFWALPIAVRQRETLILQARRAGFDLAMVSSLVSAAPTLTPLAQALENAVFLPVSAPIPLRHWRRLLRILQKHVSSRP